eukprot:14613775-Ditylum_brightwellii.AAC.1
MHILIKLGQEGNPFQPVIFCLLNTGAGLLIGWEPFILGICTQHPQCVAHIIKAKDQYTPIQLTDVVLASNTEEDKLLQSTHLPEVVKLYMPYKTLDGNPTSLKIAIGNNVV